MRMRSILAPALAAAALLPPVPVRADTVDDRIKEFEDYLKTNPDAQGLCNQIADLATKKDPRVAKCIMEHKLLRHKDETVCITAAQAVGKQGDPKVAGPLEAMADAKELEKEKKFKLMAAYIEGIGDADAKGHYKFLIDTAKKYLDLHGDVASAAYRAASNFAAADTVDDMVKELGRADYTTNKDNAVKKASRGACKPVLIDILKKMTGKDIADVKIWQEWWDKEKKTWKPAVAGKDTTKDLNASDTYSEDAYGLEIKRPNKAWTFRRLEGGAGLVTIEALDEGQKAAWVEVYAQGTKTLKSKTPEQFADEQKANMEPKFRDIKNAEWAKKCSYAGLKGIEQVVDGQHKDFDAVHMRNVYEDKSEVMYFFVTFWKSGKKASLESDIDWILKNWKCTR